MGYASDILGRVSRCVYRRAMTIESGLDMRSENVESCVVPCAGVGSSRQYINLRRRDKSYVVVIKRVWGPVEGVVDYR